MEKAEWLFEEVASEHAETSVDENEVCNVFAQAPEVSRHSHDWELGASWLRACELQNGEDMYPYERNWCWVGFKQMCHWNLKEHKPWSEFQSMAAKKGIAPPPGDAPFFPLQNPEVCERPELGQAREWTAQELSVAHEWFKSNVAVYVLSLPSSTDRWKMIKARLEDLEIAAERVNGVDMRVEGALAKAKDDGLVPQEFNFTRSQELAYSKKHAMGPILGTLGCASAHFKVQSKVMADGSPLAVVFEDDSWPSDDFVPRLWSLVKEELPCNWEATLLLTRCGYGKCISPHLMRVEPDTNEPAWRCHQGVNWGMHAVLYRTKKLAKLQRKWKKVVFDEERPRCMDVDVALASISDEAAVYAVPAVQDPGFVSETDGTSTRWDINQASAKTAQTTSTTASSEVVAMAG
jgi:GR25 family glycosyltransferase involved in LPS biosynthesis